MVANSEVTATFGAGIQVEGDRARIVRNRAVAGTPNLLRGIELSGSDGRIAGNSVTGGWLGAGILVEAGARNVIADNEVSDIRFLAGQTDNRFGDGIVVDSPTTGTLVRNNLSQRNDGDGIEIRAAGTRLRDNGAFDNRLLGHRRGRGRHGPGRQPRARQRRPPAVPQRVLLAVGPDARLP